MSTQEEARAALWAALGWDAPPASAEEALTHRSFANERQSRTSRPSFSEIPKDNQRLEFLGDAVLGLCTSELLMAKYPHADEGELSRMRAALVKAESLAMFARSIGLGDALRLGRGADAAGDRHQMNVLADALEALVAAAYVDGDLPRARELVSRIVESGLARATDPGLRDPKSDLQERVQGQGKRAPVYRLASQDGPDHDRWFVIEVLIDDDVVASGRGRSKKLAEQEAARAALAKMGAGT
jgi:ribonuclease-3